MTKRKWDDETVRGILALFLLGLGMGANLQSIRSATPPPGASLGDAFRAALSNTKADTDARKLALYREVAHAYYAVLGTGRDLDHLRALRELARRRAQEEMTFEREIERETRSLRQARLRLHLTTGLAPDCRLQETHELPGGFPSLALMLAYKQARGEASSEVRQLFRKLTQSLSRAHRLEKVTSKARARYHEQSRKYSDGNGTSFAVLNALEALRLSRRGLDRTRYDALSAYATLQAAIGQTP
jgi:hypothetical protein